MPSTAPAVKAKKVVELRPCGCGCGTMVPRSFAVGHDARHKGALLRAFDAGDAEAGEELLARNWKSAEQLIERTDRAEAKAAKKVAVAEAKAAAKAEGEAE